MKKQIILGTAGHIDHGKSSLVRALTGVDPDRLQEEKRRGITIELGFAQLPFDKVNIGLIDVPGHEKFVRAMVAGATGIDMVMLVIAADEGVMPQTREHLDICSLLGIEHGFVALTKVDLVDEDWLELVKDDVQEALQESFLEDAPIVEVSAKTQQGLDSIRDQIEKMALSLPSKTQRGMARLPIDRVFELKGFGPVVTGTLYTGSFKEGDTITLLPDGHEGRIRGIQVHGHATEHAVAGQRTAINIQGIELSDIHRGQVLAHLEELEETKEFDARIQLLPHLPKPLKHRASILFHAGTIQVPGRIWLHAGETELYPGDPHWVRITLDQPTILLPEDRFILRGFQRFEGNGTTLGGGVVLDPYPPRRKRHDPQLKQRLLDLEEATPIEQIEQFVKEAGPKGLTLLQLRRRVACSLKELQQHIAKASSQGVLHQFEKQPPAYVHKQHFQTWTEETTQRLTSYHEAHPLEEGMAKESLKEQLGMTSQRLFNQLLQKMESEGKLQVLQDRVCLASHSIQLQANEANVEERLRAIYNEAKWTPPRARDLPQMLELDEALVQPILDYLVRQQQLIRVHEDLFFDVQHLETLKQALITFLEQNETISAQEFKQLTGASRKFAIPLAEYFDKQKLTLRVGDVRKLRASL